MVQKEKYYFYVKSTRNQKLNNTHSNKHKSKYINIPEIIVLKPDRGKCFLFDLKILISC